MRLVVVFYLLAAGFSASAFASGEPQESLLYKNFVAASEVLDKAIAAHGGTALVDRAANVRVGFKGTFRYQAHYARPWAERDYTLEATTVYSADAQALKLEAMMIDTTDGQKIPSFNVVGPRNGLMLDAGNDQPDTVATADLAKSMREELEILPHEYLHQARTAAATLRLLADTGNFDVVCYSLDDGDARALYFDRATHLLTRVERIDHFPHKGDRLEWRVFSEYTDRGGVQIPTRSERHVEGGSTQHNVITEITSFEKGGAVSGDDLIVPAASRVGFETWALKPPAMKEELLATHDLGKGVYVIDVPVSDSRALLVAFDTFSVIVEAGDRSEAGEQILATAEHLLPKQPVRYVATSHHHPLYANGLRPYAKRGITILATPGNVDYYTDLVTRPYRIHPDAQQRAPGEPRIEVIKGKHVIKEGKQRLELHPFDYSTHVDEFVLAYVAGARLIVTGDLVYILRDKELKAANKREQAIHRVVKENKLKVENIMQTWFLTQSDPSVPYATLEKKMELLEATATRSH